MNFFKSLVVLLLTLLAIVAATPIMRVMDNSCGKENTVCAVVECCPGFVCQPFEGTPVDICTRDV